jgi:hypothetical protein
VRQGILRIRTFAPEGITSIVDARIRTVLAPAAATAEGLTAFYAARRGTDQDPRRVLASIWASESALEAAARPGGLLDQEGDLGGGTTEVLPLALEVVPPGTEAPTLLRVFRGQAREGQIGDYLEAARRGTEEDVAAGAGPVGLFLAVIEPDAFVTVSAWTGWDRIAIATGGNVEHPIATRHARHLVAGTAAHYEILPHSVSGLVRPPSLVD